MAECYILYNSSAGNNEYRDYIKLLKLYTEDKANYVEISQIADYNVFFSSVNEKDYILICGGDGTLNRFINDTEGIDFKNPVFYFPTGSGNDFARDLNRTAISDPFEITELIKNLPTVRVNGKDYRFLNGVGFGIDGYCCEKGDELRAKGKTRISYAAIAVKGLIFHYRPVNAKITVDGVTYNFKKVWLAPTMNGRYYGGGMIPTPEQYRGDELSLMVLYGTGKLKTLLRFPTLFKGTHIKYDDMVSVLKGNTITVEFDRPAPLQIDGETISGVTAYSAAAKKQ